MFAVEPPPADHPLVGRPDVVCTPHLGASTTEAQEDVSVEVAEVVVSALKVRNRLLFSANRVFNLIGTDHVCVWIP